MGKLIRKVKIREKEIVDSELEGLRDDELENGYVRSCGSLRFGSVSDDEVEGGFSIRLRKRNIVKFYYKIEIKLTVKR